MKNLATAIVFSIILSFSVNTPNTGAVTYPSRCTSLTYYINLHRTPDLRTTKILCEVAWSRIPSMTHARRIWHDLRPATRALARAHICWKGLSEIIASRTQWGKANVFVNQWLNSPPHRSAMLNPKYDHGGGYYSTYHGYEVAVYYLIDTC